jgi:hypothetical protein
VLLWCARTVATSRCKIWLKANTKSFSPKYSWSLLVSFEVAKT